MIESITARMLSYEYGRKHILTDVSFSASAGDCMAVIGDNGSGKTTLLQILAGIKKPKSGDLLFFGEKPKKADFREKTGYVPQECMLVENCSVMDNLCLWYQDKKVLEREMRQGFLKEFGIAEMAHMTCEKLSGGMKKKVSIACALAQNPDILLLDEPCAALDMSAKKKLRTYLQSYAQSGHTVVFVTHEEEDMAIATQILRL